MAMPISGYALWGFGRRRQIMNRLKGQVHRSLRHSLSPFPTLSETADELKDIYLVTSAHTHVNNKDVEHFSIVKRPVKLFTQALMFR
jgi:hypothetical protein